MDAFIRHCHGTLAEWNEHDPVLAKGEVALVATDPAKPTEYNCRKVGDGQKKFSQLPLLGYDCLPTTGTSALQPMSQKATTEAIAAGAQDIITQTLTDEEDKVPSNAAIKRTISSEVTSEEDTVPSSKAVRSEIDKSVKAIPYIRDNGYRGIIKELYVEDDSDTQRKLYIRVFNNNDGFQGLIVNDESSFEGDDALIYSQNSKQGLNYFYNNGIRLWIVIDFSEAEPYKKYGLQEITDYAYNVDFSPAIKAVIENENAMNEASIGVGGCDFIQHDRINLFNYLYAEEGYIDQGNTATVGHVIPSSSVESSGFIAVKPDTKYSYYYRMMQGWYGGNTDFIVGYDKDKNPVGRLPITFDTAKDYASVVFQNAKVKFFRFSYRKADRANVMFVEGDYPDEPIRYSLSKDIKVDFAQIENGPQKMDNPLTGKKILWLGDSIGEGLSANDGKYGWSGRVAELNGGTYYSLARSGAVFTKGLLTDSGAQVVSIITKLQELISGDHVGDYLIFEGGTNDADRIGHILEEPKPAKFGSYEGFDFSGSYDENTFCGALESLIYKILTNYKGVKIGYIIAPKMGRGKPHFDNRRAYFDTAIEICRKWGIPCLDLWNVCWLNPNLPCHYDASKSEDENTAADNYYVDGQHLTAKAYDYLAEVISQWLKIL